MKDIVVTVPAKLWFNWLCEGDLPNDPILESGTWDFYTSRTPKSSSSNTRVYVVAHGYLRGYGELLKTTERAFVRFGPGVACTLLENGKPKPIRGFQGWRYATWAQGDVVEWDGVDSWATHGLSAPLAADVRGLLVLRRSSSDVRAALRAASLSIGVHCLDEAKRIARRTTHAAHILGVKT